MHTGLKPLPKPDMTRGSKGIVLGSNEESMWSQHVTQSICCQHLSARNHGPSPAFVTLPQWVKAVLAIWKQIYSIIGRWV